MVTPKHVLSTLLLASLLLSLPGAGAPAPATARQAFDAYMSKFTSGAAQTVVADTWDFNAFMTSAFGDRFTKHTKAEQAEMIGVLQKILTNAVSSPENVAVMSKSKVENVSEFKLADDRIVIAFNLVIAADKKLPNQMEWRKLPAGWRIVDSGTNGAMLSSQLRGQYAGVASTLSLLDFFREMAKPAN